MMKYSLTFSLLVLLATACNDSEKEVPAGGPCTYKTTIYPARLVKFVKEDSVQFDAVFEVYHTYEWKDSLSYYLQFKQYLTKEKIIADHLDTGSVWQYRVDEIISGSCNPHIQRLIMEKYAAETKK